MIKQKIQSSQEPEPKKLASKQPQHPTQSAVQGGQGSKQEDGKQVGPLDQFISRGPVSPTSGPRTDQSNQVENGGCKITSNAANAIVLSDSQDEHEDDPKQSSQGRGHASTLQVQSNEVTVLSSQSTPGEATDDDKAQKEEKKTKSEPKKIKKALSKAKSRKKAVLKTEKELELKREQKKKLKEEQGKAKEEKRRAIEKARKEARQQKEKEKQERKQKREEEQKLKKKREEEEREKKIQQRKQAQTAKNNLVSKLKQFAKTHSQYSDDQGNIKYPVADQLLLKFPYVSIRGQKGTLTPRPEPSDLGFVLPMTFQLWINLSNFLEYLHLESFSLEAFHEALAFQTEDDVPLLTEIIKSLLFRIIDWIQNHCDQAGAQDFFDDKDQGKMSLLKNFFKEVKRLKDENQSLNKSRSHYQQPFECKVMDVIWPELLRWVMTSELFERLRDENTDDIAFTLKGLQNPREFMRLSYHYKLLSLVFLLKIVMSRSQFRTHLTQILVEKSDLVQAKQKKQKEQKEISQAVQELLNQIKSKNTQIKQMEKQLEQKTLVFQDIKEENEEKEQSADPSSRSSKPEPTELVLDRQESIRVRRQISHLENDLQRLIRRKNDQERRLAGLVNSVNSIDARLNGIKMRHTPLCTDHQGRRYWYFQHDSSRLYVQGPAAEQIGYYHKSSQFHELVKSYDECGIKQRRVLEELRRVAGLLDMQDDDGNTPMKGQGRFIEKQVAGQGTEDQEEENKKEDVAKELDFEEKKKEIERNQEEEKEEQGSQEKEYDFEKAKDKQLQREEKTRSDYLTEALQYKIEEEDSNGGMKYYTRRGGDGPAQREFCAVFTFEKLKEYIQDMELRFSQAINTFLASKWGAQGE